MTQSNRYWINRYSSNSYHLLQYSWLPKTGVLATLSSQSLAFGRENFIKKDYKSSL